MSVSIVPHSGVAGSCGPRPRKPRPATSMIAVAIASVPWTITGEIAFGRMCENRITRRRTPTARAARTKSFSRCARIDPRRSRAQIDPKPVAMRGPDGLALIEQVEVLFLRAVRGDQRREERARDEDRHEEGPENRTGVANESVPGFTPQTGRPFELKFPCFDLGD